MTRSAAIRFARSLCAVAAAVGLSSCRTVPHDYRDFLAHPPRSILVLPPLNESTDVEAPYVYLSTVTMPLAEHGYYVLPVAVVDHLMKANGLPTPGEMHQVPLERLGDVFGADAVLYVTIRDWGTKYILLDSVTVVKADARLVDVRSGMTLWSGVAAHSQSSAAGASDPIGMLISALLNQVIASVVDPCPGVARAANAAMVTNERQGLLMGDYHPLAEKDRERRRKDWEAYEARLAR